MSASVDSAPFIGLCLWLLLSYMAGWASCDREQATEPKILPLWPVVEKEVLMTRCRVEMRPDGVNGCEVLVFSTQQAEP